MEATTRKALEALLTADRSVTPAHLRSILHAADHPAAPQEAPPEKPMISTEEAAARLGVHVETVRRWIRAGRLAPVRVAPKLFRLRSADVDALLAGERTAEPAAPPPERLRAAVQRTRKAGK